MTGVIEPEGHGYRFRLGAAERDVIVRLLGELRELLDGARRGGQGADAPEAALLRRLFPVVHPDDRAAEAEYQHLMRGELVASRVAAIDTVVAALDAAEPRRRRQRGVSTVLTEAEVLTFMQAVNGLRLVLGTMLDVTDGDEPDDELDSDESAEPHAGERAELTAEHHLYGYLSWLLDSMVMALSSI